MFTGTIKEWSILTFFSHDRDLTPPPVPLHGGVSSFNEVRARDTTPLKPWRPRARLGTLTSALLTLSRDNLRMWF